MPFSPNSALCVKNYPWNINYIPAVIFYASLDFGKNCYSRTTSEVIIIWKYFGTFFMFSSSQSSKNIKKLILIFESWFMEKNYDYFLIFLEEINGVFSSAGKFNT